MRDEKKQPGPKGFILVDLIDKGNIVEIPLTSNKVWLTLFYALPEELVSKANVYLDFPRCPYEVLRTDKYDELINDDIFLELVWDCTAWAVWQYFEVPDKKKGGYREIPGTDMNYSGDFPIWRLAYVLLPYLRQKFETNGLSFQSLFNMTPDMEVPYFTYQQYSNLIGNLVPIIVKEQNWQPMIDEAWNNRAPEDYSEFYSQAKADFTRTWDHSRTKVGKMLSIEELAEKAEDADSIFDIPDPCSQFETRILDKLAISEFTATLSERDMKILELKNRGYSVVEIAQVVGYQSHGAVVKRLKKITDLYDDFVSKKYQNYLETF